MNRNHIKIVIAFINLLLLAKPALSDKLDDQRLAFLQAQKYLAEKNDAAFLATSAGLADYVLYPYLRYQWLKDHLSNTDQVLAFLAEFKDTRYAPLLRAKWLDYLAGQVRWQDFIRHYVPDDDSADDCQYHWANYQTGKQQQALVEAKRLWLTGKPADNACLALFSALQNSPLITSDLSWQRFLAAIENNHAETARSTSVLLKAEDRKTAESWLQLHQKPELIENNQSWQDKSTLAGRLFAYAIKRLATADLEKSFGAVGSQTCWFHLGKPNGTRRGT